MEQNLNQQQKISESKKKKDFEIRFYENLLKEKPDFVQALISLGDAYTRKGFYQEGLVVDRKLANLKPNDPVVHYNLACSLSLIGNVQESLKELSTAVLLGYDDFEYIAKDPDLENLRLFPRFALFFNKLKKI